jgi:hypothetical protein
MVTKGGATSLGLDYPYVDCFIPVKETGKAF